MPDLALNSQLFDIHFHSSQDTLYLALLSGHVNAFAYAQSGECAQTWSLRPSKKSCRGLALDPKSGTLYSVSKDKSIT